MSSSREIHRPRQVAAFVMAALLATLAGPVGADPFGGEPGGYPWRADGRDHWYCFHNIAASDQYRYHNAMGVLDTQTVMHDVHTTNCGNSTDVMYISNPQLDARGIAVCVRLVAGSSTVCDAYWVATNIWQIAANPGSAGLDISYNKTIAHETGHTAGLTHNPTTVSAMRSGSVDDLGSYNFLWGTYEAHHVNHINGAY